MRVGLCRCASGNHDLVPVDPTRERCLADVLKFRVMCTAIELEDVGASTGAAPPKRTAVEAEISTCGIMQVYVSSLVYPRRNRESCVPQRHAYAVIDVKLCEDILAQAQSFGVATLPCARFIRLRNPCVLLSVVPRCRISRPQLGGAAASGMVGGPTSLPRWARMHMRQFVCSPFVH